MKGFGTAHWHVDDPVKFLLGDIEGAEQIEILKDDEWSFLFRVEFKEGRSQRGIYYKPTSCISPSWELEDEE